MSTEQDRAASSGGALRLGRPRDWAFGAALLAALVAAVHFTVGWADLLAPWRTFPPLLLAWLFLLTSVSYALRAVRVHDYFRPRFAGCFPVVLRLSVLHNTANNLMPMRTGEMVFPWLMRRYFGEGLLDSAAALMWIRLLDLHFLALLALLILNLSHSSWIWWAAALLWVAGLAVLPRLQGLANLHLFAGEGRVRGLVRRVLRAAPRRPWLIVRVYLWTGLVWSLKFAAFTSVLHFFLPADLWRLLTGVMGAELSSVLPFHGIAGSGSYEVAAVAALVPLGIDPKLALAAAVNLHLFLLGNTLVLGALALLLPHSAKHLAGHRAPDA
ncbi:lysylphosphatidylglycerol synthase transmembrane domain-containing protein [Imhoffiella purpurea]|uniref:Uncharacterized protein n=1 Tax=Imhoffiella purpurea TaxID=1249627 RepID=W9V2A4_9GAMM|nr:lysylphosphatidylglycerol synthase transmembrane domain-containing protein [Imhoffiella purpurea]EXJ13628.1 hypothetical protein D779_3520 [Imhoffiella purpurea]